jgi:TolB-like protein/class 3 adenylate cyclase/Tfp pilus assembly protein PilF
MEKDHLSRKLAVILHADVVGSTSLVQKHETLAHKRIQTVFHRFSETINSYSGKTREIRGDALVAEFDRASDGVAAAIAFQILNEESNASIDDEIKPQLRVGISLGEVIIADNTITGAGVVLAQRLEQLAESGGVVVQGSVSETVPTRMPFEFKGLGGQMVKGFDQPVRAFSVSLQPGENLPAPEVDEVSQTELQAPSKLSSESYEALIGEHLELPENPSIAVLPFQNIGGDSDQEYLADGMSEDIITTLSRVPDLIVIARNSTLVYKGCAVDVRQVGQELGVQHVLNGSIRKIGDRMRVTAQLVDTLSGDNVWAEHYDRRLEDIFAIQDEITRKIVVELQVKLGAGELSRLTASGTDSVEAWGLIMRAGVLVEAHSPDDTELAKQLTKSALELDNNYSHAWVILGWVCWQESVFKWSSNPEGSMQEAFEAAQKAIAADVDNPSGYSLLGNIYMVRGDKSQAIEMCRKAIEIAPGNSYSVAYLANVLVDIGQVTEGIQKMKRAIRLCPFPPVWYFMLLGTGYHLSGNNQAADIALNLALERDSNSYFARLWLASTLVEMGRLEEAREISKATFSALSWAESFKSESHARLKNNLRAAGFSE